MKLTQKTRTVDLSKPLPWEVKSATCPNIALETAPVHGLSTAHCFGCGGSPEELAAKIAENCPLDFKTQVKGTKVIIKRNLTLDSKYPSLARGRRASS
jgi:hypothetical protein